jgi:hypothetical protein
LMVGAVGALPCWTCMAGIASPNPATRRDGPLCPPQRSHSGDGKHRMRKVPLPSPWGNTYVS